MYKDPPYAFISPRLNIDVKYESKFTPTKLKNDTKTYFLVVLPHKLAAMKKSVKLKMNKNPGQKWRRVPHFPSLWLRASEPRRSR